MLFMPDSSGPFCKAKQERAFCATRTLSRPSRARLWEPRMGFRGATNWSASSPSRQGCGRDLGLSRVDPVTRPQFMGFRRDPSRRDQGFGLRAALLGLLLISGLLMMAAWSLDSTFDPDDSSRGQPTRPFKTYQRVELLHLKEAYETAARDSEARFRHHEGTQSPTGRPADLTGRVAAFEEQARRSAERRRLQAEWASHSARLAEIDRELALRASPVDRWILAARGVLR